MGILRRRVIKGASTGGLLAVLVAGLLRPLQALAWNKAAFEAKDIPGSMKALGVGLAADSKDLLLSAPDIAESGAVVPIAIVSNIPNTVSLAVFVDKNPAPLSGAFNFSNGALPDVSMRVKMGQSSVVRVVAKTGDGKFYQTQKEVRVTAGGCGE